ncbi:hypothetical protein FOJ82_10015 [Tessaracoccus rhinocerotis]|uniref:Uncharacterized protein n=1 Tax=Tessaracoccus rhinocerotis TaxID=1689449 RepID=A0A553K0X3_9ACTN|nr:hypothetical protein [Tessaracoccus rhinocerotis]TRY18352.1 hypothetical protein FOJ82_10015 [Tessaracoccus rhinocerotis]
MRRLRLLVPVLVALVLAPLTLVAPQASADVDIYTTPGYHDVNGRRWHTECEPYSQTRRCTTKIWATQVSQVGGRFVQANDWVFNNLTYAASDRSLWSTNPLAANGVPNGTASWTAADGRKWRTECDTPATGRNGCRSYVEARVIESYTNRNGTRGYQWTTKWIFNNIVRFHPGSAAAFPTAPPMKQAPAFLKGRRHFTLGTLVTQASTGSQSRGIGRISNIELDPGGKLGTFTERYWAYTFDMAVESDYGQFRASIPNLPTGCLQGDKDVTDRRALSLPALRSGACDVRTARSFLAAPTVRHGTYEALSGNRIKLYWRGTHVTETFLDATAPGQSYSELRLTAHAHPNAVDAIGFMLGSTQPRGAGRSLVPEISQPVWQPPRSVNPNVVSQSQFPYSAGGADKTMWFQSVGKQNLQAARQAFQFEHYTQAGGSSGCIVTPPATRGSSSNYWHSYMCPLATDGKMVWHHMVGALVADGNGLCPAYEEGSDAQAHWARCLAAAPRARDYTIPARGGGHVFEALQAVDDNNRLVGIIGLETSLYSHKASSQSQLGLFATVRGN